MTHLGVSPAVRVKFIMDLLREQKPALAFNIRQQRFEHPDPLVCYRFAQLLLY